jgi:hypothetical protein
VTASASPIAAYDTAAKDGKWQRWTEVAQASLATRPELAHAIVHGAGLLLAAGLAITVYTAGLSGMGRVTPARTAPRLEIVLGSALSPIALVYLIAHHVITLVGRGENAWYAQLLVLTLGHVIALTVAPTTAAWRRCAIRTSRCARPTGRSASSPLR